MMKILCCFYLFGFADCLVAQSPVRQKRIKHYRVTKNDATQIRELIGMAQVNYSPEGQMTDSTNYSFITALRDKYVYVSGENEGLRLTRKQDKHLINRYEYKYDLLGNLEQVLYFEKNKHVLWKEYYKYFPNGRLQKIVRFKARKLREKKESPDANVNNAWRESFVYDENGTMIEHREYYDGILIEKKTYGFDEDKEQILLEEYYDPSFIKKSVYTYNDFGNLEHKLLIKELGVSVASLTYAYDELGRLSKQISFSHDGLIQDSVRWHYKQNQTLLHHYSDMGYVSREIILDYRDNSMLLKERKYDGIGQLLSKKVYSYSDKGRLKTIQTFEAFHPFQAEDKNLNHVSILKYD
ncbi:MAG: hypothetical protein HOG30_05775 [Candidatus Marinimicrobia bacterium]|nr:hypothetical protein [Candidatus Neomarinimicrobiota bacterium]MBT5356579.1 hypothetical protein [Candidatus Neomarinimicrobiota bacterium]